MKPVRLLPVVIAAGLALLVLKGVGLVTEGGYVLVGSSTAQAAGADSGASHDAPAGEPAVPPTMLDESPTLDDAAPTLPLNRAGEGDDGHGEPAGDAPAVDAHGSEPAEAAEAEADCLPPVDDGHGNVTPGSGDCGAESVDAAAEGVPMMLDGAGEQVPLAGAGPDSEEAVLGRLGDRREELEAREAELDMRLALIEAAERRIDERTAALEVLETRIAAMVDEKKVLEEEQFVAIVAMYEAMKPKDAAAIFDQLELPVMLRVARAMSPRKMSPIMAKMDPMRARDLTSSMAIDRVEPTIDMTDADLAALPQIVGE